MSAGVYNFTMDQGSDFATRLTLAQGGAPVPLNQYAARAQLRTTKANGSILVASFTCTIFGDPANGQITMELSNSITKTLTAGRYVYDLEIYTANDALVTRLLQGDIQVTPETTK